VREIGSDSDSEGADMRRKQRKRPFPLSTFRNPKPIKVLRVGTEVGLLGFGSRVEAGPQSLMLIYISPFSF
jgi:hypothetical protein